MFEASEHDEKYEVVSVPLQYFETNLVLRKKGNIVEVFSPSVIKANSGIPAGSVTFTTSSNLIPVGFRPLSGVNLYPQSTGALKISVLLSPNGTITGWNYSGTTSERKSNFLNEAMYFASDS